MLSPKGVGEVIKKGWDIKRERQSLIVVDGKEKQREDSWTDDDAHDQDEILSPVNDRLYVIDNPSCSREYDAVSITVMRNFREWVNWNGERCSDYASWYYRGTFVLNGITHTLGSDNIPIPEKK